MDRKRNVILNGWVGEAPREVILKFLKTNITDLGTHAS